MVFHSTDLGIRGLGSDGKKPNFCYLGLCTKPSSGQGNTEVEREGIAVSPLKMFQLMLSSFDQAVKSIDNKVSFEGQTYRVPRKVNAPITMQVKGLNNKIDF